MKNVLSYLLLTISLVLTCGHVYGQQVEMKEWMAVAICKDGRSGVQFQMSFRTVGMAGKALYTRCYLSPEGEGRILRGSDPEAQWTLPGGYSGRNEMVLIKTNDEEDSVSFFVPFSVMDFKGNYNYQIMVADLYICSMRPVDDRNEINTVDGGKFKGKFLLAPVSIKVAGSIEDAELEAESLGDDFDLGIAACSENVVWSGSPGWIHPEGQKLHIDKNEDVQPRQARLTVRAADGGNAVSVLVKQAGHKESDLNAKINNVWQEPNVVGNQYGARMLRVHVDFDIDGLKDKSVRAYARFYTADGKSPLLDSNGEHVIGFGQGIVGYDKANFDNFTVNIINNRFQHATNLSGNEVTFYIGISADEGETWLATSGPYIVKW
ncbi:MAG: hypothetical protein K6E96_03870 [Bacteroidales bacterium]|nr:hypothetical protein [Bacteroidales bacterium]